MALSNPPIGNAGEYPFAAGFGFALAAQMAASLPFINVKDAPYNALLDGSDEGTVLNLALAALPNGGILYIPGVLTTSLLHTISNTRVIIRGIGSRTSRIEGSNTTGVLLFAASYCGLEDIGVHYTGAGAYGVKIYNGTADPGYGVFEPNFRNLKIWGPAGTSHGLWLVNTLRGYFDNITLPAGGGEALRLEASGFNKFSGLQISINNGVSDRDGLATKWINGISFQKQAGNVIFQSDDNTFIHPQIEGVTGSGIYITSVFGAGFNPGRNLFIGGTSEGNGVHDIFIDSGHSTRFYGVHCESVVAKAIYVTGVGSHNNAFFSCDGDAYVDTPGVYQGIQGTMFVDHQSQITIGANVFGTIIVGSHDAVTDAGTETYYSRSTLANAPNAVTENYMPRYNDRVASKIKVSAQAIQGSGGAYQNVVDLASGYAASGVVHVWGRENGSTNFAYYQIPFVSGSGNGIGAVVTVATVGATSAQMTFQLSGSILQALGVNAAAPTMVSYMIEYWQIP